MPNPTLIADQKRSYKGPSNEAPSWVRKMVANPLRRFLMHPITIYAIIVTNTFMLSLGIERYLISDNELINLLIAIGIFGPTFGLIQTMAFITNENWYERIFDLYQKKHPQQNTPEEPKRDNKGRYKKQ